MYYKDRKTYYCAKCKRRHQYRSDKGMQHNIYESREDECIYCKTFRKLGYYVCPNCGCLFPENLKDYD